MLLEPGQVVLRLGWLGTYVTTQHDDFDDVQGQGAIPIVHDQNISIAEARLALDVGLTRRFGLGLMLPVRLVSTGIDYLDGDGQVVQLVEPSTHHRNETLTGLADPTVLGSVTHAWGRLRLTGRAGLSIPLGRTEENPFDDPDMPHQHIQMGTGTVNPIVAGEVAYSWDAWRIAGFGFTQQIVYENSKGYQGGDRYATGIALRRALGKWSVRGGLEMQAETYETWGGDRYLDEGNQGRIDAMFAGGASWAVSKDVTIDLALKIPFINHVVGGQLRMPALLEIGAAWTFGAKAPAKVEEEDHDHEHGDGHDHAHEDEHEHVDTAGADVQDVGKNGEAVDLVPVPGKITIFDFWATWCEPCKKLDPILVELAKKYPDHVALRKIDVIDWDTPVVARYLTPKAYDMPHVKIYDAKGALLLEESSGPGKLQSLIDTIRSTVEGAVPVGIVVTEHGFEPAAIDVPRGKPVTLRFLRKTIETCATEVIFDHDGKHVERELPLDKPVEITVTFERAGTVEYGCAMDKMIKGTINVRQ